MKETVWDLTALYSDIGLWEKDFAALQEKAEKYLFFRKSMVFYSELESTRM